MDNHLLIDDPSNCQSPNHNPNICPVCKEAEKYANVTYCPECEKYFDEDGNKVKQPNWTDCKNEICNGCIAFWLENE